jgi:ABC-type nitrate/sulfonate/bicarbonate transport system permease component
MRRYIRALIAIALFLLLWEVSARADMGRIALFPPPTKVFAALVELARSGDLLRDLLSSMGRALLGFVLGSVSGIVIGLLTGRIDLLDNYCSPIIQLFRPLPPVAIIPLVIVWFGIGEVSKVFSIAFAVFFPVWINAHLGAREVPITYLWSAKTMGVTRFGTLHRIIFPSALPFVMAGLRNGISLTFVMVFVSELAGASSGIGYEINSSYLAYRVDRMIAALLVLGVLGALGDLLVTQGAWMFFPWLKIKQR